MGMVVDGRMMIRSEEREVRMKNVVSMVEKGVGYEWKKGCEIDYVYWY